MSKLSKRIRKILSQQIEERYKLMDNKVYRVIKKVRSGLKVGKEVNDAVKMLEDAKKAKDKVEDTDKAVDYAAKVLDARKIASEASRKASVLLAAPTNPAAAAAPPDAPVTEAPSILNWNPPMSVSLSYKISTVDV